MTRGIASAVVFLGLQAAVLHAQADQASPPSMSQVADTARSEFRSYQESQATVASGTANPAAVTFVESAATVPTLTVAVGNSSRINGYQFPVTLALNPALMLDRGSPSPGDPKRDALTRSLSQLEVNATYAPLVIKPRSDQLPGVASQASTSVVAGLKIPLLGTRTSDDLLSQGPDLTRLQGLLNQGVQTAQSKLGCLPNCGAEFQKLATQYVQPEIDRLSTELKHQFKLTLQLSYQDNNSNTQPDAFTSTLILSKFLKLTATSLAEKVTLGANIGESWFGKSMTGLTYNDTSVAFGPTITAVKGLDLSVQGSVDHYTGAGFPGVITGLTGLDPKLRTDGGLVQSATFQLPIKASMVLSVKELHVGTGKTDLALSAQLRFNPLAL